MKIAKRCPVCHRGDLPDTPTLFFVRNLSHRAVGFYDLSEEAGILERLKDSKEHRCGRIHRGDCLGEYLDRFEKDL